MFLSPLFLLAAALGAAVPLLLHLMQNKRKVQLPFPTLRFLKLAQKHSSRRIRLENFLLWLLRTLIMAALGMAFAMPMIRRSGLGFLGEAPRDVAIVLDASYSMGYRTGRGTVWDKSIEAATAIISGLSDKDRYCLYLARDQPEALIAEPIVNKQDGLSRLKALQPGLTGSQLAPAVSAASKALRKAEGGRREREIHIITDNQALAWQGFGTEKSGSSAISAWNPDDIDKQSAVFVTLLGVPAPENAAVVSVEMEPSVVRKGSEVKITAKVVRTGPASETAATLFIDGKEAGRRSITGTDPESSSPSFSLPPLEVGMHVGRIETPDDNLPIDNAFHFLIRVQDQMPALVVGNPDDTLFLRTAIRTGLGRPGAVVTATAEQITEKPLSAYASVMLCNALPVSGQALTALEDYVKTGGLVVIFPGMKAPPDAYKAWTCLPAVPTSIAEVPSAQQTRTLTWDKPQHILVRSLREGAAVPTLAVRRQLIFGKPHEATERLISMGAEQPFLLDRPFGDGRVLMFAVSADRTWSDFPLSPFYLPLVLQCAEYGAGVGARAPFLWATDSLSLSEKFPEIKGSPILTAPDGKPVAIRSAVVQGRTVLIAEGLGVPGIYTLASSEQPDAKPALAINLPREESDLTPINQADIPKRLGTEQVHIATDLDTLRRLIEEQRVGRTYGEHLLWLALLLIAIEFYYANVLLRRQGGSASKLSVDAAGHVSGRVSAGEGVLSEA